MYPLFHSLDLRKCHKELKALEAAMPVAGKQ
jgi:hypothetical protein